MTIGVLLVGPWIDLFTSLPISLSCHGPLTVTDQSSVTVHDPGKFVKNLYVNLLRLPL